MSRHRAWNWVDEHPVNFVYCSRSVCTFGGMYAATLLDTPVARGDPVSSNVARSYKALPKALSELAGSQGRCNGILHIAAFLQGAEQLGSTPQGAAWPAESGRSALAAGAGAGLSGKDSNETVPPE